jgi:hypothetical protein
MLQITILKKLIKNKKNEFCDNTYFLYFNIYKGIIII